MAERIARCILVLLLGITVAEVSAPCRAATTPPTPLRADELLALVAGNALPENIIQEIQANGLAFRPDDSYRSLLKLFKRNYADAEKYFFRAVDINEKGFGESSDKVAKSLLEASAVYFVQKDYAKAEPYVLRAVRIDEALYGHDNLDMLRPLASMCALYEQWDKAEQTDERDRWTLTLLEKQYGATSPVLVSVLTSDAKALRAMGRTKDADEVEQRAAPIRSATMTPNTGPTP